MGAPRAGWVFHWWPSLCHLPGSQRTIAVGLAAQSLVRIVSDSMELERVILGDS